LLLISGQHAYCGSGAEELLSLLAADFEITRFSEFTPNPKLSEVEMAARRVYDTRCDAVVAIGGGTALDIAKAAALFAVQDRSVADHLHNPLPLRKRDCVVILVPTTAGSGSEATSFCVIYVEGVKKSLDDPLLQADYAIVDPDLTANLPTEIAASSGLDALCQAIESFWSVRSTSESRRFAATALQLTLKHLESFCGQRSHQDRMGMARASHLAGKAINITRTTAPHAISYGITAMFGIPHGHACALTIPAFLKYNASAVEGDVADPRGLVWVQSRIKEILEVLHAPNAEMGRLRLIRLIEGVGLQPSLTGVGLGAEEIDRLAAYGYDLDRASNNPRRLTAAGVREVLFLSR
jgi:alcohol dehydrogenase